MDSRRIQEPECDPTEICSTNQRIGRQSRAFCFAPVCKCKNFKFCQIFFV